MPERNTDNPFSTVKGTTLYGETKDKFGRRISSKDTGKDPIYQQYADKAKSGVSEYIQDMQSSEKWGEISDVTNLKLRDLASMYGSAGVRGGGMAGATIDIGAEAAGEYASFKGEQAAADWMEKDKYRVLSDRREAALDVEKEGAEDELAIYLNQVQEYDASQKKSELLYNTGQQQFMQTLVMSYADLMSKDDPYDEYSFFGINPRTKEPYKDEGYDGVKEWMNNNDIDTQWLTEGIDEHLRNVFDFEGSSADDGGSGSGSSTPAPSPSPSPAPSPAPAPTPTSSKNVPNKDNQDNWGYFTDEKDWEDFNFEFNIYTKDNWLDLSDTGREEYMKKFNPFGQGIIDYSGDFNLGGYTSRIDKDYMVQFIEEAEKSGHDPEKGYLGVHGNNVQWNQGYYMNNTYKPPKKIPLDINTLPPELVKSDAFKQGRISVQAASIMWEDTLPEREEMRWNSLPEGMDYEEFEKQANDQQFFYHGSKLYVKYDDNWFLVSMYSNPYNWNHDDPSKATGRNVYGKQYPNR